MMSPDYSFISANSALLGPFRGPPTGIGYKGRREIPAFWQIEMQLYPRQARTLQVWDV